MTTSAAYTYCSPSAPYRLRVAFYARLVFAFVTFLAVALLGAYMVWDGVRDGQSIRREQRIWQSGTTSSWATFKGNDTMRYIVCHDYVLDVTYVGPEGRRMMRRRSISTIGSRLDLKRPLEVRFNPEHPEEFALNIALDVVGGRWAAITLFTVFGALFIVLFGLSS